MGFNIKYNVENIGNISKASITIKPLTIIAGENSSGKTFITKSLYTVLNSVYKNHFAEELIAVYTSLDRTFIRFNVAIQSPATIDVDFEKTFSEFQNQLLKFIKHIKTCNFEDQDELVKVYNSIFTNFEADLNKYFKTRLKLQKFKKYNAAITNFRQAYKKFQDVVFYRRDIIIDNIATHLEIGFKKNFQITDLRNLIKNQQNSFNLSLSTIGEVKLNTNEEIEFNFHGKGIQKVQNVENIVFFDSPVYIKIKKVLQKKSLNALSSYFDDDNDKFLKGYPEYLDKLYEYMENEYIDTPDFDEISKEIEELISGGLNISKSGEIVYNDKQGNSIPLSLTAMGISNIGLIDLLIKNNTINKGSFLIMDEPEVHLHPKWQVALANILYKIAKSGANVIIATHSLDLLKAFEIILKNETEDAEKIIAINKMPYDKKFTKKTELEKVQIVLDDLSRPYYNLYLQDV